MVLDPLRGRAWWEIFRSLESALEGVYGIPVSCLFCFLPMKLVFLFCHICLPGFVFHCRPREKGPVCREVKPPKP